MTAASAPRVLLIFLDGIGIGDPDATYNPFLAAGYPFLTSLLGGTPISTDHPAFHVDRVTYIPIDATQGMDGFPQSGTGQTALFTGMNAAHRVGRHFGPYVYSTLKPLISDFGIFTRLQRLGLGEEIALANAFPQRFFDYLHGSRRRMVAGMYMAYSARVPFRDVSFLKRGEAVSTDITAIRWKDIGHSDAPVLSPYDAGTQLAAIAGENRFTLYEYFRTDKPGHDMDMEEAVEVLTEVDAFLRGVFEGNRSDLLVVITSDHGNLEDLRTKTHTRNDVPLIAFGCGHAEFAARCSTIMDITPTIVRLLANGTCA